MTFKNFGGQFFKVLISLASLLGLCMFSQEYSPSQVSRYRGGLNTPKSTPEAISMQHMLSIMIYLELIIFQPCLVTCSKILILGISDMTIRCNAASEICIDSSICSTILSGGNQVDGLPPASSMAPEGFNT